MERTRHAYERLQARHTGSGQVGVPWRRQARIDDVTLNPECALTLQARMVYVYLAQRADFATGTLYIKRDRILADLGNAMSESALKRALNELRDAEYVTWERTTPTVTTYTLKPVTRDTPTKPLPRSTRGTRKARTSYLTAEQAVEGSQGPIEEAGRQATQTHREGSEGTIERASDRPHRPVRQATQNRATGHTELSDRPHRPIHKEQLLVTTSSNDFNERESEREDALFALEAPQPKTSKATNGRGTRLPEGWEPSAALVAYAVERGVDPGRTVEDFRDWWAAASGANAVKRDWDAAWRTWVRREADRRHAAPVGSTPAGGHNYPRREGSLARVRRQFAETAAALAMEEDHDGDGTGMLPGARDAR